MDTQSKQLLHPLLHRLRPQLDLRAAYLLLSFGINNCKLMGEVKYR
jgi:hypothetical protein